MKSNLKSLHLLILNSLQNQAQPSIELQVRDPLKTPMFESVQAFLNIPTREKLGNGACYEALQETSFLSLLF